MPADHISSLYALRLRIAKKSGRLGSDAINDYEKTAMNLQDSKSKELGIIWVYTDHISYLVFYEPDNGKILGVLKSKRKPKPGSEI